MNFTLILGFVCVFCSAVGVSLLAGKRTRRTRRNAVLAVAAVLCLLLPATFASAQEVVHARTGQLVSVDPASKTLTLKGVDGSKVIFQDIASHEPALSFDKAIREKTVPAATYSKIGSNVVIFYYGYDTLTAVAIKELGADALKKSTGSVAGFDRHDHSLTLKTDAAEPRKVLLNEDTVVDTSDGVVRLADYKPAKGALLRCVTKPESQVALLVAPQ